MKTTWIKNKGEKGDIILVDINDLKTNPNEVWSERYKTEGFGKEYTDKISESISRGIKLPALIVKPDNTIIDGQHRYYGAIKAGLKKAGVQYTTERKYWEAGGFVKCSHCK